MNQTVPVSVLLPLRAKCIGLVVCVGAVGLLVVGGLLVGLGALLAWFLEML